MNSFFLCVLCGELDADYRATGSPNVYSFGNVPASFRFSG